MLRLAESRRPPGHRDLPPESLPECPERLASRRRKRGLRTSRPWALPRPLPHLPWLPWPSSPPESASRSLPADPGPPSLPVLRSRRTPPSCASPRPGAPESPAPLATPPHSSAAQALRPTFLAPSVSPPAPREALADHTDTARAESVRALGCARSLSGPVVEKPEESLQVRSFVAFTAELQLFRKFAQDLWQAFVTQEQRLRERWRARSFLLGCAFSVVDDHLFQVRGVRVLVVSGAVHVSATAARVQLIVFALRQDHLARGHRRLRLERLCSTSWEGKGARVTPQNDETTEF
eukprot:scaffold1610_cov257-Pinguiococcus_pyrenoidosus.AAC.35